MTLRLLIFCLITLLVCVMSNSHEPRQCLRINNADIRRC